MEKQAKNPERKGIGAFQLRVFVVYLSVDALIFKEDESDKIVHFQIAEIMLNIDSG